MAEVVGLLKERYPILEKHGYLMPFMQARRWLEVLLGGKMKRSVRELREASMIDDEKALGTKNLFDQIGL